MRPFVRRMKMGTLLSGLLLVSSLAPVQDLTTALNLTTAPGTLVRWTVPGTTRCSMKRPGSVARSWAAVGDTCYYPIDIEQKPGSITVFRTGSGRRQFARISVEAYDYGTQE